MNQYAVVLVALAAILVPSGGRDLRPSDHGLEYQSASPPPAQSGDAEEMRSFFGASDTASLPTVELPEAKNISDTWLGSQVGVGARDGRRDHVKVGLVVASAVCLLTGVVLLAISGVVLIFRLRKEVRKKDEGVSSSAALTSLTPNHKKEQISV